MNILLRRCKYVMSEIKKLYDPYVNDHIKRSLAILTSPSKLKSKQVCQIYFQKILSKPRQQRYQHNEQQQKQSIKSKFNMIFSTCFQLQNFHNQRNIVCKMICDQKIHNQSLLDRVLKWINRNIKFNSLLDQKEILLFIQEIKTKQIQFLNTLKQQVQSKGLYNIKERSQVIKKYRQQYPHVDSQVILTNINLYIQQNESNETKYSKNQQNKFWDKILNIKPRGLIQQLNTPQIYSLHKQITNGRLRFRFPPEPNGYLHIGHVKSIRMNFQTAKKLNGICYLRYDDTNPEKENHQFIQEIQNNIKWLNYKPDQIKFTSDYFQQMLGYASKLIDNGHAYVCESPQAQIQVERRQKRANPYRQKPISYSQKIFPNLSEKQVLRLKLDPSSANPTLRDPIIYRFKSMPHPRTCSRYSIYPMYDFAHCISDSIQHIDYSLCSLQFEIRRQLYYTILDLLGLYKPIVWQFSRLNIAGNVLSKRKIKQFVDSSLIQGWDDPRLLTVKAMERRGYTPNILFTFIDKVNASRSGNQKVVQYSLLQKEMKKQLAKNCQKFMALRNPIKIQIYQQLKSHIVYVQKQQYQKLQINTNIILKESGVYKVWKKNNQFILQKSSKTVDEIKSMKKQNQKLVILSWISQNFIQKKVIFYEEMINQKQQFNKSSKKQESLFINADFQKVETEQNAVFLFQRIGYFKKDKKWNQLICCVQV